jgi:predicted nucleic acid-binding protein
MNAPPVPGVVDASALIELLLRNPAAEPVATAIAGGGAAAPGLLDAEVLNVLARLERSGELSPAGAEAAADVLTTAPIQRLNDAAITQAAWSLRNRVSLYDAMYAGLAHLLACPLITADERLARAVMGQVAVTVVPTS